MSPPLSIADMLGLLAESFADECPRDPARARLFHDLVRADASTGVPTSVQGQHVLATARDWPDMGVGCAVGECTCRSSLVFQRSGAEKQPEEEPMRAF